MKTLNMDQTNLDSCVSAAQQEEVMLMRNGTPIAVVVGLEELDEEQIVLGQSDEFWRWINERRKRPLLTHEEVKLRLGLTTSKSKPQALGRKSRKTATPKTKRAIAK